MSTQTTVSSVHPAAWLLVGSEGLWAVDCLVPGCGWTATTGAIEAATAAAIAHANDHHATTHTHEAEVSQ
jgi:predicted small metal-binding protein